jgi:hypothetical protein
VRALDEQIAAPLGATVRDDASFCEALARSLARLHGLPSTVDALGAAVSADAVRVEALALALLQERPPRTIARGTAIQYWAQLWAGNNLDAHTVAAWLGRADQTARLLKALSQIDITAVMSSRPRSPMEIEAKVGLLPEPYRSQLPRLPADGTFFIRYDELAEELAAFRAGFHPGETLFLVERNLDVPYERILPIARAGELIVLVCRGPGAGRLASWTREDRGQLAPTSIQLP